CRDRQFLLPRNVRGRPVHRRSVFFMRRYEMMVILDPQLDERAVAPSLDQYLGVVRSRGGTIDKVDVWGKRRLSFEIKKHTEGIYAVLDLSCTPAVLAELDRQLSLSESVLRTKVLRRDSGKG